MKKVLFVATVVKTHIMEFHIPFLKMFKENGWETYVAARNDYENPDDCKIPYCDHFFDVKFERNPLKIQNLRAYRELKNIIHSEEFDIIHCHTPVGGLLTRLAARNARNHKTKVFYTAHGFHFYKGAPLINWLVYYPVEKLLSKYTDVLITINKEDYNIAKDFNSKDIYYVPGVGVDLEKFNLDYVDGDKKRKELGLKTDDFVILSVGELIPRKNHEVVIRALSVLQKDNSSEHIEYVICGRGVYEENLRSLARELKVESKVHFLGYRNDIPEICKCSDLFVFMSHQEGLPVALMEAMACGLPVICSDIRGNTDLIENELSGIVIKNDPKHIATAITKIRDKIKIRQGLVSRALKKIELFSLKNVEMKMAEIYGLKQKQ